MSGSQEADGEVPPTTTISSASIKQEENQVPLMVAMQPGVEIPVIGVEEVIVTDGNPESVVEQVVDDTSCNQSYHGDQSYQDDMVTVGAEEEIEVKPSIKARITNSGYELDEEYYASRSMVYSREGVTASAGPPPVSSGESDSDESLDENMIPMMHASPIKLPKKRDFAYRLQWRNKDMLDAMKSVEEKKMTIRGASKKFLVPYSTLKDRVHGRVRHGTKPGVKTALSPEEEDELVRYVKDMEAAGFQLRNSDVRERAGELLRLNYGHSSPYGDGTSPGHNWLQGFMKRHVGLEFKRQFTRSMVPSCSRQRAMLRKFYEVTGQVYKKNRISTKPERVYSVSEMKIGVFQKATIIYCGSASGSVIPPFVIFKGQQKLKLTSAREAYSSAFFTSSVTGQVTEEIFLWWFRDHFLKVIPRHGNRPLVLLISQPCINVSLQMYQLAKEERVIFIAIPTGISHLLQPLDEELGTYVESCLSKKAKKWEEDNPGTMFTQKILAQLLQKVWKKALTVDEITHKFGNVGIYPLNIGAITTDKILAMSHALRETMRRSPSPTPTGYQEEEEEEEDPMLGLSLLSALSSHEYASIGRGTSQDGSQDQGATPRKRLIEEFETPMTRNKRRRTETAETLFQQDLTLEPVPESVVAQNVVIEQPGVNEQSSSNVSFAKLENVPHKDVTSEITQARENLDQINRAIDSILSEESTSAASGTDSKAPLDNVKVMRIKLPSPKKKHHTATRRAKLPVVKPTPRTIPQNVYVPEPPRSRKPTKKIIFMLNKEGQLVSRTEVTPNTSFSGDRPTTGSPSLREALTGSMSSVFTNVKVEDQDSRVTQEVRVPQDNPTFEQVEEQQIVEETDTIFTSPNDAYVTTGSTLDGGYSIANRIDEQPPQHLLQDEELDLETVDTIMINGQLFKVIRAPKEPEVKQEVSSRVQVQLEDGTITEVDSNCITEDGVLLNTVESASVIHQEVVQDYEVASFDVPPDGLAAGQTIIEEQVV